MQSLSGQVAQLSQRDRAAACRVG